MSANETASLNAKMGLRAPRDYKNYINGQWVASKTGKTFESRNPADNTDLVGTFQDSNVDDVNAAVAAAKKAFHPWRLMPAARRRTARVFGLRRRDCLCALPMARAPRHIPSARTL